MRESVLRQFFLGDASAATLEDDLQGSTATTGVTTMHSIEDMEGSFVIEPSHLIRLCDAVIDGSLSASRLQQIGFCVLASDTFVWDGDIPHAPVLAATLHEWAAPQIFFPLTTANAEKWKLRLQSGRDTLGPAS